MIFLCFQSDQLDDRCCHHISYDIEDGDRPVRWPVTWSRQVLDLASLCQSSDVAGHQFLRDEGVAIRRRHNRLRLDLDDGWLNGGCEEINAKNNFVCFSFMTADKSIKRVTEQPSCEWRRYIPLGLLCSLPSERLVLAIVSEWSILHPYLSLWISMCFRLFIETWLCWVFPTLLVANRRGLCKSIGTQHHWRPYRAPLKEVLSVIWWICWYGGSNC